MIDEKWNGLSNAVDHPSYVDGADRGEVGQGEHYYVMIDRFQIGQAPPWNSIYGNHKSNNLRGDIHTARNVRTSPKGCITRLYVSRHYISLDVWGSRYNVVSLDLCCWNGRCSIFDDSRNWHFASMASVILSVSPTIGHCMPSQFWYPVFVLCRKIKNNPVSRPHDHSWVMTCICHSTIWLRIIVKWMLRASY